LTHSKRAPEGASTLGFTWVKCGHPNAYLVDVEGNISELECPVHAPLGTADVENPTFTPTERKLAADERVILHRRQLRP
jgi:hypothetical protein